MMNQELTTIFNQVKSLMKVYEPPFNARVDDVSRYDLWSEKQVSIADRKYNDVYFSGLIIQSNYVGFYFMPLYIEPQIKGKLKPELLKLLKGKTCFHIKKLDDELVTQLRETLETGFKIYKDNDWISNG